ncbi:MAG: hypothetical protein ACFFBD_23960 [Candidatus Hodarchaeota archaeon]
MKIDKWALFDVSRKSVRFTLTNGVKGNSNLLTQILPFGSSPGEALKYVLIDDVAYFSYLKMNGETGKGIVLVFDSMETPENLLGLVPELTSTLITPPSETILTLEGGKVQPEPITLRGFDYAIFSLLTQSPIIAIGTQAEILRLLTAISFSTPQDLKTGLSFVSQSTSLSENVNLIGMPLSKEVLEQVDATKGKYTIVLFGDRVYGRYSSQLTKKIGKLAKTGHYRQIKQLLADFWQIVIQTDEITSALDFAANNSLHLSDAQLALIMRAKYFEKEMPKELFKEG